MCSRMLSVIATAITIVFASVLFFYEAQAVEKMSGNQASPTKIEGTITTVELDGTIVVATTPGFAVIMYAREGTKISRNGKPAQIKDLRVGDKLWARYVPESRSAVEVRATGSS